jgi:hypothetical protein
LPVRFRTDQDEEDIAISAFDSFFKGVKEQRFPRLNDRNDLWRILLMITARKAIDQINRVRAPIHGGGKVHLLFDNTSSSVMERIEQLMSTEPTPEFAALIAEQFDEL